MSSRTESALLKRTMRVLLALAMALYFAPGLLLTPQNAWAEGGASIPPSGPSSGASIVIASDGSTEVDTPDELMLAAGNSDVSTINIVSNIDVTSPITFTTSTTGARTVTVNGNGRTITNKADTTNSSASAAFVIDSGISAIINQLTIDGDYADNTSLGSTVGGHRGISVDMGGRAVLTNCTIKNNKCAYGAGIRNSGTLVLDRCSLTSNHAVPALDRSGGGGGGAIETQGSLYANNTVIANNSSVEIGGGANVYMGHAYLMNCTVTNNATSSSSYSTYGGIGIHGASASLDAVNCIIAGNSYVSASSSAASDIGILSGSCNLHYCLYGTIVGSFVYDTTNHSASTGDLHSSAVDKSGAIYCPVAANSNADGKGTKTYCDFTDLDSVKMSYESASGNTKLGGLEAASSNVDLFFEGTNRSDDHPVIGASGTDTAAAFVVKHWQQKVDGQSAQNATNFRLADTDSLTGTTGASVTPGVKSSYTGFTVPSAQTVTIATSGPTVVDYYYTRSLYTVSFNENGHGTAPSTQTVRYEAKASAPSPLAEAGYTFGGWYKEPACTTSWDFANDKVLSDTILYAKWTAVTVPTPPSYVPAPDPTPSVTPSSPTGIDDFGTISGVSDHMQYKLEGADAWTDVPAGATQLTGLPAGTYLIRYKGYSAYTKVVVAAAPAYSVELKPAAGGTATADKTTAMKGETVTFSATADEGFNLRGWMVGGEFVEVDSIAMPAGDIIVEPVFTPVQTLFTARAKASAKSATLSWMPVEGAVKYRVYLAKADGKLKRVTTIELPAAEEGEVIDEAAIQAACAYTAKKLKSGIIYKLRVVAVAEDGSRISSSPIAYVTPKGKSYANASKLSVSKKSVSLGAGEKTKVSAKVTRLDSKGKKLLKVSGVKKIRYMSSEPTIVKVTKYGNITALRAGTAYIYAIAADGVYKQIKVTVE